MKPMIDQAFWSDPDIEAAKSGVKLSALWLITNPQTNLIGLCSASASRFEFETGLPVKALDGTLEALPRAFAKIGQTIFVKNYIRHQFGTGEKLKRNNFFVALKSLFLAVRNPELSALILSEYPEFSEGLPKPFEGLPKPKGREGKIREGSEEGVQGKKPKQTIPPDADEALTYAAEIGLPESELDAWHDHFAANGWKIGGKTKMIDWKASLRTWARNRDNGSFPQPSSNGHAKRNPDDCIIR